MCYGKVQHNDSTPKHPVCEKTMRNLILGQGNLQTLGMETDRRNGGLGWDIALEHNTLVWEWICVFFFFFSDKICSEAQVEWRDEGMKALLDALSLLKQYVIKQWKSQTYTVSKPCLNILSSDLGGGRGSLTMYGNVWTKSTNFRLLLA